jgi:putative ABC transport system permease protein
MKTFMLAHDLRLALRSLRRTPGVSVLMVGAEAVGIAAAMIAITLYHVRAGNPIPWKDGTLFAVTLDTRGADVDFSRSRHPDYPPDQVTYQDARALYASNIPMRSVMMYRASQVLTPDRAGIKPIDTSVRVTTADFFSIFDVPMMYGSGWSREDDDAPAAVVVLSKVMNQKLFGGENSVGRNITLSGRSYRVLGVTGPWMPRPKYYDLTGSDFAPAEDVYLPFGWMRTLKLETSGSTSCLTRQAHLTGFDSLLTEDCVWLQYWVEFRRPTDRDRFQALVDRYTDDQRTHGRFERKNNNRIVNVPTWLNMGDVIGDRSRIRLALGLTFLGVCVLNTLGLMLSKFMSAAPIAGLRRALGASRRDITRQHLVEATIIGLLGGSVGLLLTVAGLTQLKWLMYGSWLRESDNPDQIALVQALVHMDLSVVLLAIALSILAGVLTGIYPAYRVGRMAPATFLKTE